jgi:hypothetical protein
MLDLRLKKSVKDIGEYKMHGTVYYIDLTNGDDANDGLEANDDHSWLTIAKYTSVTVRTAGDIAKVRANTTQVIGANVIFDEDGTTDALISIIGCDSVVNDPWGDASDVRPIFDLNGLSTPHLNYARSFYCFHGPGDFDDTLSIILSNGLTQVVLEQLIAPLGDPMAWSYQSIALNGLLPFTNSMQLFIRTADYPSHPNITEAAFDHFSISNASILELAQDANAKQFVLYPNPGQDQLFIEGIEEETTIDILQLDGKYCYRGKIGPGNFNVNTQQLPNGIYFVKVKGQCYTWVKTAQ